MTVVASGACTISALTVHLVRPGSCELTATQAGNDHFKPADAVVRKIVVARGAFSVAKARLTGTAEAGERLTVRTSFQPAAERITYVWFRDGQRMKGVGGKSYRLRSLDRGTTIQVKVKAFRTSYDVVMVRTQKRSVRGQ